MSPHKPARAPTAPRTKAQHKSHKTSEAVTGTYRPQLFLGQVLQPLLLDGVVILLDLLQVRAQAGAQERVRPKRSDAHELHSSTKEPTVNC